MKQGFLASLTVHLGIVFLIIGLHFWKKMGSLTVNIPIEVYEYPKEIPAASVNVKPIEAPKPTPPVPQQKAVFGVSKNALTDSSNSEGVTAKLGNTVAKAEDNEKLKDTDATSLPIPADEFLVTKNAKPKFEVRPPYPAEARSKGIEGPVVMDVLIDEKGRVRKVDVVSGPGSGLNESAAEALLKTEFEPAFVSDKAVAVKIRFVYRFRLDK